MYGDDSLCSWVCVGGIKDALMSVGQSRYNDTLFVTWWGT